MFLTRILFGTLVARAGTLQEDLEAAMGPLTRNFSAQFNMTGCQTAVMAEGVLATAVGGYSDGAGKTATKDEDLFAVGSLTKFVTAVSLLRLFEHGRLDLDEKAVVYADKYFTRLSGGTSLLNIFGEEFNEVTVRQLMNMRAGLWDYDTDESRVYQNTHKLEDIGPVEILTKMVNTSFYCAPGTCGNYASTNYAILGLVLAGITQPMDPKWQHMNQKKLFGPTEADLHFATSGPCGAFHDDAHANRIEHGAHGYEPDFNDSYYISCLEGWTCGNMVTNAKSLATIFYEVFGRRTVLKTETLEEMADFQLINLWPTDPQPDLPYGLGLMGANYDHDHTMPHGLNSTVLYHAGEAYGYQSYGAFYKSYNFTIGMTLNAEFSGQDQNAMYEIIGEIYKAASYVLANHTKAARRHG